LAPLLAKMMSNTYSVDCNKLLDKEMDRKTEVGLTLSNMLAKGQVPPLAITLELIKDVVNLTSSDSVVIENCPLYIDQIESIATEFRIEKVCYIDGDEQAMSSWRSKFLAKTPEDSAQVKVWGDRKKRLSDIVTHFSRLGKLDRLTVSETPKEETLTALLNQATMPQFILVTGLSTVLTPNLAELIAASLNVGAPPTLPATETPGEATAKLKKHAESCGYPILVLDRAVNSPEAATEFLSSFGTPQLIVNVNAAAEFVEEEFKVAHEDMDEEVVAATLQKERTAYEATVQAFKESCASAVMTIELSKVKNYAEEPVKAAEEMCAMVKAKLVPKAYVVVAPSGDVDFGSLVASSVCTTATASGGAKPAKFTVVDCAELFQAGKHSPHLEDALHKASFTADAPDCLSFDLWTKLFSEAFASAANPMGPFLITNFPSASALSSGPSIRDQFGIIESLAILGGILHVRTTDEVFAKCCSGRPADLEQRKLLEAAVQDQISKQYDKNKICDCLLESVSEGPKGAVKAAAALLEFMQKAD